MSSKSWSCSGAFLSVALLSSACSTPSGDVAGVAGNLVESEATLGSSGSPPVRVAWLGNDSSNSYDNANRDAAAVTSLLLNATLTPFYSGWDPQVQLSQCYDAVRSGEFDALIILAADANGIVPCVAEADQRGIPVVASDLQIGPDPATVEPQVPGQVGAVLIPPATWGADLSTLVVDLCATHAPCNVVYIAGSFGVMLDQIAIERLQAAAAAHPNVEIVAIAEAWYDPSMAYQIAHDLLANDPDVHVIIGAGDQMAQGVEQAIAEIGTLPHPIEIVGAGAGAYGVQAVRDGRWHATFMALPSDEGALSALIAIRAARNQTIWDAGINPVELRGYDPFFTEDNQNDFPGFFPQWPG